MPLTTLALALAFGATIVGVGVFALGVAAIWRTVGRGQPAPRRTDQPWRRTWLTVRAVIGHGRFAQRPWVRVAHWAVMVSFPVLLLSLVGAYGQLADPRYVLPVLGRWAPLELVTELIAWVSLVGIVLLIAVRQLSGPRRAGTDRPTAVYDATSAGRGSRFFGSNAGQAYLVEAVVLVVVLAVLVLRGLERALEITAPQGADVGDLGFYPLTGWLGQSLSGLGEQTLTSLVAVVALVKIMASMTWMVAVGTRPAMGVSWHRFLAVVNIWARREVDGRPALGPLTPVRAGGSAGGAEVDLAALDDLPPDARLGVGRIEDLTWKGLLDLSTCTECGRCQEQCPAWNTGKPLSPKLVVMALRDHAYATSPWLNAAANGSTAPAGHTSTTGHVPLPLIGEGATHEQLDVLSLVGDVVDRDALWDCTTCGACVQQCPVDIEHVDHIVDLRRNEVLMAATFPAELGPMFTKLERRGNPWGLPGKQRLAWAADLPFDVPVVGRDVEDASGVDYLFWVGCAGAYEDRARRTTRAVAELLHVAGVSFAVLGDGESCTGDPARRAGNELLYQTLAAGNVAALDAAGARRIVVTCAHCFNTIAREYPQLGGSYQVLHHTELLDQLVRDGRLRVAPAGDSSPGVASGDGAADGGAARSVTYHDPCYLGRHNEIYSPPRDLIGALPGVQLVEMPRTRERSFCCGGGGARVWLEESVGTRIGTARAAEAVATGADAVATGCPFCTVMLTDGVAAQPDGPRPEVVDVAQLLLESVRGPGREPPSR